VTYKPAPLGFRGAKIESELWHQDIDDATVLSRSYGEFLVKIETVTSRMYRIDDAASFDPKRYLSVKTRDPKLARNLSTIINAAR
jgi:hypothetical protein